MKRILTTVLLACLAGALTFAAPMHEPHTLVSLWKQYEEAHKADRPQKEAEILTQIKQEALQKHLITDFYDAATEYVQSVQRRDWKQRDALRAQLRKEVEEFNEPIVTFRWMEDWRNASTDELWAYVKAHPDGFQGCTRAFYSGVDNYLGGTLKPFIASDKEYVLWRLFKNRYYNRAEDDEIYQALLQEVKGRYPGEAALALYVLDRRYWSEAQRPLARKAYTALAEQYAGKAVSLYPRAKMLDWDLADLNRNSAPESAYKELYKQVQAFEKERAAYKGDEAVIAGGCTGGQTLSKHLTGEDLDVEMGPDGIKVVFKNLSWAKLTLRGTDTPLKEWKQENPAKRFYLRDTVSLPLPKLPDGDYSLEAVNGELSDMADYVQYTLSVATRTDAGGRSVYVTDYKSGQPLQQATLVLRKGDREMARSSLKLNGFTPLPEALDKVLDKDGKSSYTLVALSGDRKSLPVDVQLKIYENRYYDRLHCYIYKDQGAYRPGDVVNFKAVIFNGHPATALRACEGKTVEVRLIDSQDKQVESKKLTTNAFGSISGSFTLPAGLRNGSFRLDVGGIASDYFQVDEFVLPSFDLQWDSLKELYFSGDTVPVDGEVVSYSGHNLSGANLILKVNCYGDVMHEEEQVLDGRRFHFEFPARREGWYHAELTVVDPTGETRSFQQGFYVGDILNVEARVENTVEADFSLVGEMPYRHFMQPKAVVRTQDVRVTLLATDGGGRPAPIPVRYQVKNADDEVVLSGEAPSGETVTLQLPASGLYTLVTEVSAKKADGKEIKQSASLKLLCTRPGDKKLADGVLKLFLPWEETLAEGDGIHAVLGSGSDPVWAVVTLYGRDCKVLAGKQIKLDAHSLANLDFACPDSYPDAMRLQVFYFLNGSSYSFERVYRRAKDRYTLPLQFTRFSSDLRPGTQYSVQIKTAPGVEALAAVWDKSLDAIAENRWSQVHMREVSVENVYVHAMCGRVGHREEERILYSARGAVLSKGAEGAPLMEEAAMAVQENAVYDSADDAAVAQSVTVRSDFATALTFQPHLLPAADGTLSFDFRTADKLSTYYLRVYAHDPDLHNALVQEEVRVSLPVKVQLLEPRYLYKGDVWEASVVVSSLADEDVSGLMKLRVGDTGQQLPVTVPAGGSVSHRFLVPASSPAPTGDLLVTAVFSASDFSDAVQVKVPVVPAAQQLTEAHSAVLLAGQDREALLQELRGRFVNVPASAADFKEITVLDMVRDAIPSHVEPACKDVLSLSEALYVRQMASRLQELDTEETTPSEKLMERMLACQNADGGFGWFEDMGSSPVITAVLLERFAKLRDRGFEVPELDNAVQFLDKEQFGDQRAWWRGGISDAQYMYVRALYAQVPFDWKPVSARDQKRWDAFCTDTKTYLAPSDKQGRGLQGQILPKARRVITLRNLVEREGGTDLAKAWGVKLATRCKLTRSLEKDIVSLQEYAVEHRDGGWYYPNAVMPWRGLLESEAYAHALLCDLLAADTAKKSAAVSAQIADGVRLWLMLQKETQHWDTDPAYIDAITAILDGSQAVLDTRVLICSASYQAPFADVKASGNGFTVERKFYRLRTREQVYDNQTGPNEHYTALEEIAPGDSVQVGEKILVKYHIWNAENRSFVKLDAGREASLMPVQQLSGYAGRGYRNVKADRSEYYFDSYPEERTEITEEFFVNQAGTFQAPVVVIESLYAPHYRANDAARTPLVSVAR